MWGYSQVVLVAAVLLTACGTYTDGYVERTTVVSIEQVQIQRVQTDAHVGQHSWDDVLILQTDRIDCPTEVVGILDVHAVGGIELAVDELKRRAELIRADAVLGVEFEHGDTDEGEPIHLSGLGVRCAKLPT